MRALRASDEPAARLLPKGERWRPGTWAHFRYIVLGHLQFEGAHSLAELACDPPEVLGLPLSSRELHAVLESCRRRGFVVRLDPGLSSGAVTSRDEWLVTDEGRKATRPAIPWFIGHAGRVSKTIFGVAVSLVGVLGIGLTARGGSHVVAIALPVSMALGLVFWVIVGLRHRSSGGRGGRVVAEDWVRWRYERPALRDLAFKRFPWGWFALSIAISVVSFVGLLALSHPEEHTRFLALAFILAYFFFLPVLTWNNRWNEIESSEIDRRTEAFLAVAMNEMRERERLSGVVADAPGAAAHPSASGVD